MRRGDTFQGGISKHFARHAALLSTLWMRKLSQREVKWRGKGQTATLSLGLGSERSNPPKGT